MQRKHCAVVTVSDLAYPQRTGERRERLRKLGVDRERKSRGARIAGEEGIFFRVPEAERFQLRTGGRQKHAPDIRISSLLRAERGHGEARREIRAESAVRDGRIEPARKSFFSFQDI